MVVVNVNKDIHGNQIQMVMFHMMNVYKFQVVLKIVLHIFQVQMLMMKMEYVNSVKKDMF